MGHMAKGTKMKKVIICMALAAVLLTLTSCASLDSFREAFITGSADDDSTVRIGVYEPLSGSEKDEAAREISGIELAYSLYPTVDGRKVELVYQDNRSEIEAAEAAINELLSKKPAVILGSYGDANSLAASSYINENKVPAIAITNTNPLITAAGDYYFRVCIISPYQGDALAYYAYNVMKARKACVLVQSGDEESATIAQRFMLKMQDLSGDSDCIAVNTEYDSSVTDYSAQLELIKTSGAEAVLLPGSANDAAAIIEQADEMNMDVTFLGVDSWDPEYIARNVSDKSSVKAVFVRIADAEAANMSGEKYMDFMTLYENKYGEGSAVDNAVALGFDAYSLAVEAIRKAGSRSGGEAIMKALKETGLFEGATGTMSFDSKGDPLKSVTVYSLDMKKGSAIPGYTIDVDGKVKKIN